MTSAYNTIANYLEDNLDIFVEIPQKTSILECCISLAKKREEESRSFNEEEYKKSIAHLNDKELKIKYLALLENKHFAHYMFDAWEDAYTKDLPFIAKIKIMDKLQKEASSLKMKIDNLKNELDLKT